MTSHAIQSWQPALAKAEHDAYLARRRELETVLSGHQAQIAWWDCVLMLDPMDSGGAASAVHLEYEGKSTDASVPCATQGIPGDGSSVGPLVPVLVQ